MRLLLFIFSERIYMSADLINGGSWEKNRLLLFIFSESKFIAAQVERCFQNYGLLTKLWQFMYTHHNGQTWKYRPRRHDVKIRE